MSNVFVIWDNSNIHYGGLDQVRPIKEPNSKMELYRTHFMNLLNLVASGRPIGKVIFVGSTPPESDGIWNYLRSIGIKPETIARSADGSENDTTDHLLQAELLRLAYDYDSGVIALLSGDGAGINQNKGFFADLKRINSKGWQVEVYSWDETCHTDMKQYAQSHWSFTNLSDYYEHITFLQGVRPATPLR